MFIKLTSWLLLFFVLGPLAQAEDVAPDCPVVLASSETYQQQMAQMVWQENRVGQALEAWRNVQVLETEDVHAFGVRFDGLFSIN